MTEEITFHWDYDGLATITVSRPEARNALNWAAQKQFSNIIDELQELDDLRVVIVTGVGHDAFISGGDLKEMALASDPDAGERLTRIMGSALEAMTHLPVPVIAAVNGDAFGGGCEVLTACDIRIAAAHASFSFAEVRMALTTGWGGTWRLVQLIGLSRALDLLLHGRVFSAQEAEELGFINRVVPEGTDVLEAAREEARIFIALPKDALAAMKELAWASTSYTRERVRSLERDRFTKLWFEPDHTEAMNAFTEKRKAIFNRHREP